MVVGGVIAAEVIVHLTAADMHIDYDATLLIVQNSKARQHGDLISRTKLFIKDAQQFILLRRVCVFVVGCVCGLSVGGLGPQLAPNKSNRQYSMM